MRWTDVGAYVRALRGLLAGETVEWDSRLIRMQHLDGYGAARPVDVSFLVAADGPKGFAVANDVADGVFFGGTPQCEAVPDIPWRALIAFGTVLDDGESPSSQRARAAVASQLVEVYHVIYELGGADAVDEHPGGRAWREGIERIPEPVRHLEMHEGHLVRPNAHDGAILDEGADHAPALLWIDTAPNLRRRIDELAAAGVTEVAFQPSGPDLVRELEAFAALHAVVA
jgi:5,10-methylenetetrahydromethanopterin reductase